MLTGRLPITGATNYEIMTGHLQRTPIAPVEINPSIPLAVSHAVMRALAKDPLQRFANASDFNAALQAAPSAHGYGYDAVREIDAPWRTNTRPPAEKGRGTGGETTPLPSLIRPITSGIMQRPPSSGGMESLPLEELTKKLAVFIGPVAKFVVKKLAAESSDMDQLYAKAAKQIPSDADRQKFLRSRKR